MLIFTGSAKQKAKKDRDKRAIAVIKKSKKVTDFFGSNVRPTSGKRIQSELQETQCDGTEFNFGTHGEKTLIEPNQYSAEHSSSKEQLQFVEPSSDSTKEISPKEQVQVVTPQPIVIVTPINHCDNLGQPNKEPVSVSAHTRNGTNLDVDLCAFSSDLGEWPPLTTKSFQENWIAEGCGQCQHNETRFLSSVRYYEKDKKKRWCKKSYFTQVHGPT